MDTDKRERGHRQKRERTLVMVVINRIKYKKLIILSQTIYFKESMMMNDTILIVKK